MRILVVQHEEESPIGYLAEPAEKLGMELKTVMPTAGERLPPDHETFDGMIALGGVMNAEDDEAYPHLRRTAGLIRNFHRHRKPVLGICLGAQLTARALGAPVHRDTRREIGYYPARRTPEAEGDALLDGLPEEVHLIQYHLDSFDLPEGAVPLLTNETCPNQAFRAGHATYAFQAHIEASPERMKEWLKMGAEFIETHDPDLPDRFAEEAKRFRESAHAFALAVGQAWFNIMAHQKLRRMFDAGLDLDFY